MLNILSTIEKEVKSAFVEAGLDEKYGFVSVSNRPDLCQYQCNGAMPAAKAAGKKPIDIAQAVADILAKNDMFEMASAVMPGFININLSSAFLADYAQKMLDDDALAMEKTQSPRRIMMDYGGPNVAKPLHVGHLRSAVIGESIKRMLRFMGDEVIADVHLGDFGLQMGLIVTELKARKPELVYFDDSYEGEYPKEAPFTISELEEIYPFASAKSKEDEAYKALAMAATNELQQGKRGYRALLEHILNVSVTDLKANYEKLLVSFDLWKGESDAMPYIPAMAQDMKDKGFAYYSEGALVVDVKEDGDTKEIPPCMILKSDGASLYDTTDLATLIWRMEDYNPAEVIYVVDKRQELHFIQVFRCAKKCGIVPDETKLTFIGFGTMNGKDNKPFKTRAGGVLRLETLISDVKSTMLDKLLESGMDKAEADKTAAQIAVAAIKYGDLSNQASKDYIFDVERFVSFEGNTGPYLLYTIVRMKSILAKAGELGTVKLMAPATEPETSLLLVLDRFSHAMKGAYEEMAPHRICAYVYELANAFNHFYHETKILSEENDEKKASYLGLVILTKRVMEQCIDILGFEAPERM